jgi:hypothetical protein
LEKVGVHCEEKEEQNKKSGNSHAARQLMQYNTGMQTTMGKSKSTFV